jgi:integrase
VDDGASDRRARRQRNELERWEDVDLERKVVRFRVVKGDRPYAIPLADRLAEYLREYRERDWLPNRAGWVFPSPENPERPLWRQVRTPGCRRRTLAPYDAHPACRSRRDAGSGAHSAGA